MVSECRHLSLIANFCLGNITNLRVMFPGTSLWNANSLFICLPPASVFSTTHLQQFYMYFMRDLDIVLSNRNEYQEFFLGGKGGRCVGLTTLPPSCAECLEIWEPHPPETLGACPGLQWDCFFTLTKRLGVIQSRSGIFGFVRLCRECMSSGKCRLKKKSSYLNL